MAVALKSLPNAYCINLDRESERFERVHTEFQDVLALERVSAIDGKKEGMTGATALYETSVRLFRRILEEDTSCPYAIVLEDDVYKCEQFEVYWPVILEFITARTDWDFISLDFFLNFERPRLEVYGDHLYRVEKSRMTGFMIYNREFLRKHIQYLSSCGTLDMSMKHNGSFIQLIPRKLIVKQEVDKVSKTNGVNTKHYETFYKETEEYLLNYRFV